MNDETTNDGSFIGRNGIELTHRNFHCTVCDEEHHIYVPVADVGGYDKCVAGLMSRDICPCGAHQECSVADVDGAGCGGIVENLEDYQEISGEYLPLFTCARHQGYFLS